MLQAPSIYYNNMVRQKEAKIEPHLLILTTVTLHAKGMGFQLVSTKKVYKGASIVALIENVCIVNYIIVGIHVQLWEVIADLSVQSLNIDIKVEVVIANLLTHSLNIYIQVWMVIANLFAQASPLDAQ